MFRNKASLFSLLLLLLVVILWMFVFPLNLTDGVSYSTVVVDRNGRLLGARVSADEQWRFPIRDSLPEKYVRCLIEYEDRGFYSHFGVSPSAVIRAALQNIRAGKIVSGGSTITMQVARMVGKRRRGWFAKILESIEAVRIECRYSKSDIVRIYAGLAPYGGNVVGYEAACWRYLGHNGERVSWGEAALMSVLQNNPGAVNLRKGRDALRRKRDGVLSHLVECGVLTREEYDLAVGEPLPEVLKSMPNAAWHLVEWYAKERKGEYVRTSVDWDIQERVEAVAKRRSEELCSRGVNDLAVVVVEVLSGEVLAYCGNADVGRRRAGSCVDVARSRRSSGSLLKPLLYCAAMQDGYILPRTLLPDVPINVNGFRPHNYDRDFRGAVGADEAVSRSLNVPSVGLLRSYGVGHFVEVLRRCGFTTITRTADDYGLSLILGGAEVCLLDVVRAYAKLGRMYERGDAEDGRVINGRDNPGWSEGFERGFFLRDRAAIWWTLEAMRKVERADHLDIWKVGGVRNVAWKTGTSWGARDAWSVGLDRRYAVGVWAGNAEGHGVSGLSGVGEASPVMFDVFEVLEGSAKNGRWFDDLRKTDGEVIRVCRESGMQCGEYCGVGVEMIVAKGGAGSGVCDYHRMVRVSADGRCRVAGGADGKDSVYFVLPANEEYYYKKWHPEYISLPPLCDGNNATGRSMEFIYPQDGSIVSCIGEDNNGVVFHLAHKRRGGEVFWFMDGRYVGSSMGEHKMVMEVSEGTHRVSVVDEDGAKCEVRIVGR